MLFARQVLRVLDRKARYRWLDYVCRQGLVRPSVADEGGYGTKRQYNFDDVVALVALWHLTTAKMPKRMQIAIIRHLRSAARNELLTGTVLMTDGT